MATNWPRWYRRRSPPACTRPPTSTPPHVTDDLTPEYVEELLEAAVTSLGGEHRDGQLHMAQAVANALNGAEHALIQAGTGTGKSLGYLVPAVAHAAMTDQRIV